MGAKLLPLMTVMLRVKNKGSRDEIPMLKPLRRRKIGRSLRSSNPGNNHDFV